jgi:hypothetical protein
VQPSQESNEPPVPSSTVTLMYGLMSLAGGLAVDV